MNERGITASENVAATLVSQHSTLSASCKVSLHTDKVEPTIGRPDKNTQRAVNDEHHGTHHETVSAERACCPFEHIHYRRVMSQHRSLAKSTNEGAPARQIEQRQQWCGHGKGTEIAQQLGSVW